LKQRAKAATFMAEAGTNFVSTVKLTLGCLRPHGTVRMHPDTGRIFATLREHDYFNRLKVPLNPNQQTNLCR